jgi:hypothetical protein
MKPIGAVPARSQHSRFAAGLSTATFPMNPLPSTLIYTNGQSAVDLLQKAGIAGQIFEWLEVLHDGPVTLTETEEELDQVRAAHFAARGWTTEAEALRRMRERNAPLEQSSPEGALELWFEHDLYDQLQLIQLLARLAERPHWHGRIGLFQFGGYITGLSAEEILAARPAPVAIGPEHLQLAVAAWSAFRQPSPAALIALVEEETSALPFLRPALRRLLEELPHPGNGLGRTEAEIVAALAEHPCREVDLFAKVQAGEPVRFMGDLPFRAIVERLAQGSQPLIRNGGGSPNLLALSPTGEKVHRGEADWLAFSAPYWLGGVRIEGTSSPRWSGGGRA